MQLQPYVFTHKVFASLFDKIACIIEEIRKNTGLLKAAQCWKGFFHMYKKQQHAR